MKVNLMIKQRHNINLMYPQIEYLYFNISLNLINYFNLENNQLQNKKYINKFNLLDYQDNYMIIKWMQCIFQLEIIIMDLQQIWLDQAKHMQH